MKIRLSLRVVALLEHNGRVTAKKPTYVEVLDDLAAIQHQLNRLETHVLSLMNEAGITDEAIGIIQDLSSQRVGQKRRRRFNNSKKRRA